MSNDFETVNESPEFKEFIKFLLDNGWSPIRSGVDWGDWRYERNYVDMIYDELWFEGDKVYVVYTDIQWGYTNYDRHVFTYEEFKVWYNNTYHV